MFANAPGLDDRLDIVLVELLVSLRTQLYEVLGHVLQVQVKSYLLVESIAIELELSDEALLHVGVQLLLLSAAHVSLSLPSEVGQ